MPNIFALLRRTPTALPLPLPLPPFPYIVRDSRTHQIIARGTQAKCDAYVQAFGLCYTDTINGGA